MKLKNQLLTRNNQQKKVKGIFQANKNTESLVKRRPICHCGMRRLELLKLKPEDFNSK